MLGQQARADPAPSAEPLVLAVYGDSQAQGLAAALRGQLRNTPFRLVNRTRPATALATPATHDWVAAIQQSIATDHPSIAVLMFGGNDRVPARPLDGRSLPFGGEPWRAFYRDRLAQIVTALTAAEVRIVWCGNPNSREPRYARDMQFLNQLYVEALPASGGRFVDIFTLIADAQGNFASHGPGLNGTVQRLRGDDGIHFTAAGYDVVARRVLDEVRAVNASVRPVEAALPGGVR